MPARKTVAAVESPLVRSYRELLGVGPEASGEELKKAFRRLATLYHPDKNLERETQEQFIKVTHAYETLVDSDKVAALNKKFLDEKLFNFCVEGLNITFGSFFGYRRVTLKRLPRNQRIGKEKAGEVDTDYGIYNLKGASEDSTSILDNPAYDSIELVYGGKFSGEDDERVMGGFKGSVLGQLPWIVLNNRGIMHFLDGRFKDCLSSYEELEKRIPNNIIFLYRLGLCHAILAFQNRTKSILGKSKPDPSHLKKSVANLKRAIVLGQDRTIGKQRCLTIRKTLADIYERAGQHRLARKVWDEIREMEPKSQEARLKTTGSPLLLSFLRK